MTKQNLDCVHAMDIEKFTCVGQCRHVSSYVIHGLLSLDRFYWSLVSVAMETKGTIPTLLHFWTFVLIFLPNSG